MNYSQKELLRVFISTVQVSVNLNAQGTVGEKKKKKKKSKRKLTR